MTKTKENRINKFDQAAHDSVNSLYKHAFHFTNGIVLTGYSAKVRFKEKDNAIDNLINYVLRLLKADYYAGSSREIEVSKWYLLADDDLICSIYKDYIVWEPKFLLDSKYDKARKVLEKMVDLLSKKWQPIQVYDLLYVRARPKVAFDVNDITPRFSNDKALTNYCNDLVRKGYAIGEVETYLRNYRSRYFNH